MPSFGEKEFHEFLSRLIAAPVLGDSVYGINAEFRAGLRQLDLEFFL